MNMPDIQKVFSSFQEIQSDFATRKITSGHINNTYLVRNGGDRFILQQVNTDVFPNVRLVMKNILLVTEHLQEKKYPRQIPFPIPSKSGNFLINNHWRLLIYISNARSYEKVGNTDQAFHAAQFLGEFHRYLTDINLSCIEETIPNFTNFPVRLQQFYTALKNADPERLKTAELEVQEIQENEYLVENWEKALTRMPVRLIHADPKISNFLFDKHSTTEIKALIDWDTLMPGPILYDFGDMARSYTALKAEDDPTTGDCFSKKNYQAVKRGFLHYLKGELHPVEIENIDLAAQVVIYVQAMRFITDFLNGDIYYAVTHSVQNQHRGRSQLNLLRGIQDYLS